MIDYIGSADNIGHHHFRFQLIQNGIGADPMAVFCEISAIKGKPIKRKQMLKFHLVCFPVLCWRGSFCIAESLGEVAGRRKAQNSCDLRERKVRLGQETLSFFYAAVDDIIDGRNTVFALKGVYHIIFGDADLFCQLVQRDIFLIMVVNVALYRCTLAVGRQAGVDRHSRNTGVAHQLYNDNIHVGLAKYLETRLSVLHFPQDLAHTDQHIVILFKGINAKAALGGIGNRKFQPFDAKHNIIPTGVIQS